MKTPSDLKIIPREIEFDIGNALKKNRYYVQNNPVKSHFFTALQALFPEGERFFIDSARDVRNKDSVHLSPELDQQIKTFIRQEAIHGRHHEDCNKAVVEMGYSRIGAFSDELKEKRLEARKLVPRIFRLAITAAGEHFTACTARLELHKDPDFFLTIERPMRDLLLYHAIEEIEHKAVCFDLYKQAGGGYLTRIAGAAAFSLFMLTRLPRMHAYMLAKDGLWNKASKKEAREFVWGFKQGLFFKLLPDMIDYLRPTFHPWENDDREWLLEEYNENLAEYGIEAPATEGVPVPALS